MTEATVKPGFKTSEFWLATAATIIGLLMASGVFVEGPVAQGLGVASSVLASMGYSYTRGQAKKGA